MVIPDFIKTGSIYTKSGPDSIKFSPKRIESAPVYVEIEAVLMKSAADLTSPESVRDYKIGVYS